MVTDSLDIPLVRAPGERRLYTWAAAIGLLVVFAGFAPTYYLKHVIGGAPDLDGLRMIHGAVMTTWFTLFLVQARLVATGQTHIHRQVGTAGIVVAALVVGTGMSLAIASVRSGTSPIPGVPPLVFLVMPVGEMFVFTVLFTAAIALRKRSPWHKRLMLLGTLAMVTPAVARLPFEFIRAGGPPAFFAVTDLIILGCIAFDTAKNRRLHPAFIAGLAFVVVAQLGRLPLSQTGAWMSFAKWLVG
jgi:hypothetical protein